MGAIELSMAAIATYNSRITAFIPWDGPACHPFFVFVGAGARVYLVDRLTTLASDTLLFSVAACRL